MLCGVEHTLTYLGLAVDIKLIVNCGSARGIAVSTQLLAAFSQSEAILFSSPTLQTPHAIININTTLIIYNVLYYIIALIYLV